MSSIHVSKTAQMSLVNKNNDLKTDSGFSALDTSDLSKFRAAIPGIEIPRDGIPGIVNPTHPGIPGIVLPKPGGGGSFSPVNRFDNFIDAVSGGLKSDPSQMLKSISEQLTKSEMRDLIKGLRGAIKAQPEGTDINHLREGIRGIRELLRAE